MADPILNTVTITVDFDPGKIAASADPITLTGPFLNLGPPTPRLLTIPQGITMIVFKLTPLADAALQPQFATPPIAWLDAIGTTVTQADCFVLHPYNPNHFTVIDFNSAQTTQQHLFNVLVTYDGQTYPSDPSIVNEPPMPT